MSELAFTAEGVADVTQMLKDLELLPMNGIGWLRLAIKSKQIISERTLEGRDVRGNSFTPYSENYFAYKSFRIGAPATRVDLFGVGGEKEKAGSGQMMGSMTTDSHQLGSRVFFADTVNSGKAAGHDTGAGHLPIRKFFAISEPESEELIPIAEKDIDAFMSKL